MHALSLSRASLCVLALCLYARTLPAQKDDSPAAGLLAARASYYTPTANGLKSFQCKVSSDWKDMLTRFSGKTVDDGNPFLHYLNGAHLFLEDDLKGEGALEWSETAVPPEGQEKQAADMRGGIIAMFGGFFKTWNVYMNGGMVPAPDATTTVTPVADGFRLHVLDKESMVDETFDKHWLLTEAHVVMPDADVLAYPTYEDTPDGRVITSVRSLYRSPKDGPLTELTISMIYAPVSTFRLPASLQISIKNVGTFAFSFSSCAVTTNDAKLKP